MTYLKPWTIAYVALIVLINIGFSVVPLVPVFGEMFPPLSLAVGLIFVARDYAQREIGHKVIIAMLVAGVLSYIMASPLVAVASLAAFLVSEFADWGVYTWIKKPFAERILISSAVSTPLDSAVFLGMIGHFSLTGVILMTVAKMAGALVVWWMLKRQ
jgi:uncharacterized PurR-regulated membrane protein YhhQ (DUF165 family)|tara:strand:+ start:426 stop:899 length:474 start_codon:yes stop_codon:yes gene_type:complete